MEDPFAILQTEPEQQKCYTNAHGRQMKLKVQAWVSTMLSFGFITIGFGINTFQVASLYCKGGPCKENNLHCFMSTLNFIWLTWRASESLNWYSHWKSLCPYICHITTLVRFNVEAVSVFVMSAASLDRFLALVFPFVHLHLSSKHRLVTLGKMIGLVLGVSLSAIHLASFFTMSDQQTKRLCEIHNPSQEPMLLFFISSILIMLIIYAIPSIFILIVDITAFVHVIRKYSKGRKASVQSISKFTISAKSKFTMIVITVSSVFLLVNVIQPIHYASLSWQLYTNKIENVDRSHEIYFESILCNVLALTYSCNTLGLFRSHGAKSHSTGASTRVQVT